MADKKLYRVWVSWFADHWAHPGERHEWYALAENGDGALRLCRAECMQANRGTWGFQNAEGEFPTGLFRSFGRGGWFTGEGTYADVLAEHAAAFGGTGDPHGVLCCWERPDVGFSRPVNTAGVWDSVPA